MKHIIFRLASFIVPLFLILPNLALAQKPVGIVTALKGSARLTRTGSQSALRFKENVVLRDIIDTQESSLVRVLFGGKSTVTVRELTRLEVREELLPGGGVRSVHNLSSGSVLINVARRLMGKGDEVVIRTPNAVGAVRGTIIFAQYNAVTAQSTFVLLTGKAIITPQGQPPITLTPDSAVTISGDASAGVQAGPVVTVSQEQSSEILQESETGVTVTEEANQEQTAEAQTEEAAQLAEAVVAVTTGESTSTSSETEQTKEETKEEGEGESSEQNSETTETTSTEPTTEGTETATSESTTTTETTTASTTPTTDPIIETTTTPTTTTENTVTETLVTAGGTGETITETIQTVQISLNGETKTLAGETLYTFKGVSNSTVNPFIVLVDSNIDQTTGTSLILVSSGADATLSGTLLDSDPSVITAAGDIFSVESGANLSLSAPLFNDVGGTITAGNNLLAINGGTVTGTSNNPFIGFNNSTVSIGNDVVGMSGGSLTLSGPLLKATNGSLSFTNLVDLAGGASLISGGSLMDLTNLTLDLGSNSLIQIAGASTLQNTSGPLFKITGGSLTADALVTSDNSGNTFNLTGTILDLTDTSVTLNTLGHDIDTSTLDLDHVNLSLQNNEPMLRLKNSTLHLTSNTPQEDLLSLESDDLVNSTFDGLALIATNNSTIINDGGGLLDLAGVFSTTSTEPLVQINGSSVTTKMDSLFDVFVHESGSTNITMAGPLASVGGTLTSETDLFLITGGAMLTSNTTSPFIDFNNATLTVGPSIGHLFEAANGHLSLAGPLMHATNSNLNVSNSFLKVFGGSQISSTATSPLFKLTNTPVTPLSGGSLNYLLFLEGFGSRVDVADTLFKAQNSDLTFNSAMVKIFNGGQINTMSNNALVYLDGGTHTIGSSLFNLSGVNVDGTSGLGIDQPVKGSSGAGFVTPSGAQAFNPSGLLFKATNGANINVAGNAVRLDTALYEATLPVIELIGTANSGSPDTILTSSNTFADIMRSRVILERPFASLDKGLINVTNGALLTLSNGSQMTVADSLLKLLNGSRINVVNGPLVQVAGPGSLLDVAGALVEFGGTGGNQVIVRNNLCSPSCSMVKGVNVLTATGGQVNITGNTPILNPSLGTIDVTTTDALIKAVDSGVVNIAAPAPQ
jgi:hypothetical protein